MGHCWVLTVTHSSPAAARLILTINVPRETSPGMSRVMIGTDRSPSGLPRAEAANPMCRVPTPRPRLLTVLVFHVKQQIPKPGPLNYLANGAAEYRINWKAVPCDRGGRRIIAHTPASMQDVPLNVPRETSHDAAVKRHGNSSCFT